MNSYSKELACECSHILSLPKETPLAVGSVKRLHLQVGNQLYEENLYPLIFLLGQAISLFLYLFLIAAEFEDTSSLILRVQKNH